MSVTSFIVVGQHLPEHDTYFAADCVRIVLFWLAPTAVEQSDSGGDGGCCHTGRRSCFYRAVPVGQGAGAGLRLVG